MGEKSTAQRRKVALSGGPRHRRWFFYEDLLAVRAASRRMGYPIDHPCASDRCYRPSSPLRFWTNKTFPGSATKIGEAEVWEYVTPARIAQLGRGEYLAPEEVEK